MPERAQRALSEVAKFKVTRFQYFLAFLSLISLTGLGASFLIDSRATINDSKVLSNVETPAATIIFTQRETLVYSTRLAQWVNGGIPRREVQIARQLLAQRLAVVDSSGLSMGERADAEFWSALKDSDVLLESTYPGILKEADHARINRLATPIIDKILLEARNLVVDYQRSVDQVFISKAEESAKRERFILFFFYSFVILGGLFLILNVRTNFKNYRLSRLAIEKEAQRLDETIQELKKTQATVTVLQDLNEQKNAFISNVNHELRTPLTSIIGYTDVIRELEEAKGSHEYDTYLDVVDRNAEILLKLVESILSLSKLDSSKGKFEKQKLSVNDSVESALFLLKPASEKAGIAINFEHASDDPCFIAGDAGQLSQIFINLIGNAVKFSPAHSEVTVTLDRLTKPSGVRYARVRVKDQGIGIPKDDLQHLFTRFFRATNAISDQYPGTGLGLTIVNQSVQNHGGFVEVESEENKGTTFTVLFPEFLSSEEELINSRREIVLTRAIDHLRASTPAELKDTTHSMGGAIGFYGFEDEGEKVLDFSRALEKSIQFDSSAAEEKKQELLTLLESRLEEIKKEKSHE